MKHATFITNIFIIALFSCSTTANIQESPVGMVTYNQYSPRVNAGSDVQYYVVTNQQRFDELFNTIDQAQTPQPGFTGQTVLAILSPSGKAARIERLAIKGKNMLVYASSCTSDQVGCPSNGLSLVSGPRSGNVN